MEVSPLRGSIRKNLLAVAVGCAFALIVLVIVEAVFYGLNRQRAARETITHDPSSGFNAFRLTVGYWPQANARVKAEKVVDGQSVYDVVYTFDERHRRVVPGSENRDGQRLAVLFGGSFAFGEGLNDDETLAYFLAQESETITVRNYAFSGYGPQQALAQLQDDSLFEETPPDEAIGVYVFIPHHVRRAIGSMGVVSAWGLHFPFYEEDEAGSLGLRGTFNRSRPWRTWAYRQLAREQVLRYFKVDWPLRTNEGHLQLTARIIAAAQEAFVARFEKGQFYVVIYPTTPEDEIDANVTVTAFEQAGLTVLDYSRAIDMTDDGMRIRGDRHPTAKANELLAERLAHDLSKAPLESQAK
jgi:hypothetical protein